MKTFTNHGTPVELTPAKPYPLLKITPRARRLHGMASEAAKARGDSYVGVEHILIAIIRMNTGVSGYVLEAGRVTEQQITDLLQPPCKL